MEQIEHSPETQSAKGEQVFRGIGVSPGLVIGPVFVRPPQDDSFVEREIPREEVPREIARFETALIETRRQLREFQQGCDPAVASIFDAHLLILDDRPFIDSIVTGIESRRFNAELVLQDVARGFMQGLSRVKDDYVRERVADVQDVTRRVLHNLAGHKSTLADIRTAGTVVVANDLSPSEIVTIDRNRVAGIALDLGSPTAHAAILAAKFGIPAVLGLHSISREVRDGDLLLVDGGKGLVIVNPSEERRAQALRQEEIRRGIRTGLLELRDKPAETTDGYRVTLSANIEVPQDVEAVLECGAAGVGLFRTEYFYMARTEVPSEDEQFEAYSGVAQKVAPGGLIIRTLDLGGDKFLSNLGVQWEESNPFMGWRAIRFCLAQPDLFRTQLRAILRASVGGNVSIMYPMISTIDEIVRANVILEQAKKELMERGHPFNPHIEVGAMIEVPSAAIVADLLAPYVNFFSLGTNDLIQYTLAIDRGNERVAYLYEPTHPAILRLIKHTIDVGHRFGIWTGICGGMAGDPLMTPLLLGLGVDEMSVNPAALPLVKDALRSVSYAEARVVADQALVAHSAEDVHELSRGLTNKVAPEILELEQ
ncbi:MAG: phosphoenolpyruvate--protein phosphotransferase [Kiritimatiellia bacterium]|nr:phosphoenolpyruvate--protein phosphotransferase [Lentisphaerota bacterium]